MLEYLEKTIGVAKEDLPHSKREAVEMFTHLPEVMEQHFALEKLLEEVGGVALVLPNATPQFNPIEKVWRWLKEEWRNAKDQSTSLSALKTFVIGRLRSTYQFQNSGEPVRVGLRTHAKKWAALAQAHVEWSAMHDGWSNWPKEYSIERVVENLRGRGRTIDTQPVAARLLGYQGNGPRRRSQKVNLRQFQELAHHLNYYRRYPTEENYWPHDRLA